MNLAHQDRTETPAWPRRYLQQPLGTCKLAKHKAGHKKGKGQEKNVIGKNLGGKNRKDNRWLIRYLELFSMIDL